MERVEALVAELAGSKRHADWGSLALSVRNTPADLERFVVAVLECEPSGGTFFDRALGWLSVEQFERVIGLAVEILRSCPTPAAESVVAYASLQTPELLTSWLPQLWESNPNGSSYYAEYPWRCADGAEIARLQHLVLTDVDPTRAWRCLLQTRDPEVLAWLVAHHSAGKLPDYCTPRLMLEMVGFEPSQSEPRSLVAPASFHVCLALEVLDSADPRPDWIARGNHPTWGGASHARGTELTFGGESATAGCASCGGRLHRLLALPRVPDGLLVSSRRSIEIATCLSCLGWERSSERFFYSHDANGAPTQIGFVDDHLVPQFPTGALMQMAGTLAPTDPRWRVQDWALSNSRENLNRVGGEPTWIQNAEYPACPLCNETMRYLLQLDSELPIADGGQWLWGSGGIAYVHWCDVCAVSAIGWQCT